MDQTKTVGKYLPGQFGWSHEFMPGTNIRSCSRRESVKLTLKKISFDLCLQDSIYISCRGGANYCKFRNRNHTTLTTQFL